MSERALGFVEEWISDHVPAEGDAPDNAKAGDNAQAKALATQCLADAGAQGISAAEIGEAIDDLVEFMAGAIEEANDRKEHDADDDDDEDDDDEDEDDEDEDDDDKDHDKGDDAA
jgi:hypothetical protein